VGGRQTVVKEQSVSLDNTISPCAYMNFSLIEKLNSRAQEFFRDLSISRLVYILNLYPVGKRVIRLPISDK